MKPSSTIRLLAAASVIATASLSAQHLTGGVPTAETRPAVSSVRRIPAKAQGNLPENNPEFIVQNARTLDPRDTEVLGVASILDLDVLELASVYQEVARGGSAAGFNARDAKLRDDLELIAATYREPAKADRAPDGRQISLAVRQRILMDPSAVLEIVESEVTANPSCACEIVKSAVQASVADPGLVVGIVAAAIQSSPENMRLVSQCAIAASPDSLAAVQALLARLDPNGGEGSSAKTSAKSAKSTLEVVSAVTSKPPAANPLDRPPLDPVLPPPVFPPRITEVNP